MRKNNFDWQNSCDPSNYISKSNWNVKLLFAGIIITLLQSQSCNKNSTARIPPCIAGKIKAIQQVPKYNPPATVYRYLYGDKYVYLFSSDCCDQYNYLYDKDCNVICAPSGGIAGRGDGRCRNFTEVAANGTLIWKDPR